MNRKARSAVLILHVMAAVAQLIVAYMGSF